MLKIKINVLRDCSTGKKNFLPPSYLIMGFGFLFKVRHIGLIKDLCVISGHVIVISTQHHL